jgi:hypothetical protein
MRKEDRFISHTLQSAPGRPITPTHPGNDILANQHQRPLIGQKKAAEWLPVL